MSKGMYARRPSFLRLLRPSFLRLLQPSFLRVLRPPFLRTLRLAFMSALPIMLALPLMLSLPLLTVGCGELSEDGGMAELVEGTWAFKYETSEDLDFTLMYERVVFRPDGTCSVESSDGGLCGTYRAGSSAIYIKGMLDDGQQHDMLWRLHSFSRERIVADYVLEYRQQSIVVTITLERIP